MRDKMSVRSGNCPKNDPRDRQIRIFKMLASSFRDTRIVAKFYALKHKFNIRTKYNKYFKCYFYTFYSKKDLVLQKIVYLCIGL